MYDAAPQFNPFKWPNFSTAVVQEHVAFMIFGLTAYETFACFQRLIEHYKNAIIYRLASAAVILLSIALIVTIAVTSSQTFKDIDMGRTEFGINVLNELLLVLSKVAYTLATVMCTRAICKDRRLFDRILIGLGFLNISALIAHAVVYIRLFAMQVSGEPLDRILLALTGLDVVNGE